MFKVFESTKVSTMFLDNKLFLILISLIKLSFGAKEPTDFLYLAQYGLPMFGEPSDETGDRVISWLTSELLNETNPEELGEYFEGDILFPRKILFGKSGLILEAYHWPNGVVPFIINGNFNANEMDLIEKAMNEYHKRTCIRFTYKQPKDVDYISIESENTGCWSSVGRTGGKQVVNFQNPGCLFKVGTIIHELMHVLGFLHEQNREDRDTYISVLYNNIKKGADANFHKAKNGTTTGYGVGYDYGSVMHYSQYSFSANKQPTILSKMTTKDTMGQREGLSAKDIEKLKKMYKCKNVNDEQEGNKIPLLSLLSEIFN